MPCIFFFSYSGSYQKLYMIIIWLTLWCKFALKWQVRLINYVKRWLISNYFLMGADFQHNMVIGLKNCAERFLNPIWALTWELLLSYSEMCKLILNQKTLDTIKQTFSAVFFFACAVLHSLRRKKNLQCVMHHYVW